MCVYMPAVFHANHDQTSQVHTLADMSPSSVVTFDLHGNAEEEQEGAEWTHHLDIVIHLVGA